MGKKSISNTVMCITMKMQSIVLGPIFTFLVRETVILVRHPHTHKYL